MFVFDYLKKRHNDKLTKKLNSNNKKTPPASKKKSAANFQDISKNNELIKPEVKSDSKDHFAIFDAKLKELESLVFYDKKRIEKLIDECKVISSLMDSAWSNRFKKVCDEVDRRNDAAKQDHESYGDLCMPAPVYGKIKTEHAESQDSLSEDDKFIEQHSVRRICNLPKHVNSVNQRPKTKYEEREEIFYKSIGINGPRVCDLDD